MKISKGLISALLVFSLTGCFDTKSGPDKEFAKILEEIKRDDEDLKPLAKEKNVPKWETLNELQARYYKHHSSLHALIEKNPDWKDMERAKAFREVVSDTIINLQNAKEIAEKSGKKADSVSSAKCMSFDELNRAVHVGMKIGKPACVSAKYVSYGNRYLLKSIKEERDEKGRMINESIGVTTGMLDEKQRGILFDIRAGVGCFSVAMMGNGTLEMTDVKPGACD